MTPRTALTLAGIVVVVAGLAAYRCACRVESPPPSTATVATSPEGLAAGRDRTPSRTAAPTRPLPQVLDFGRDT